MADLPGEVQQFLAENIDSLEQLEILLLLRGQARREFTPAEVTAELRLGAGCAEHLDRLRDLELVVATGDPPRYRFASESRQAPTVDAVARSYARFRVAVISFIFSPRRDQAIRGLADAFRLRRK